MGMDDVDLSKALNGQSQITTVYIKQPFDATKRQAMRPREHRVEYLADTVALSHLILSLPPAPLQHFDRLPRAAYWQLSVVMTPSAHHYLDVWTQFGNCLSLFLGEDSTDRLRLAGIPGRDDEQVHLALRAVMRTHICFM